MKRLMLASESSMSLADSGFADLVVDFFFRFVWGALPSPDELAAYLGPCTDDQARGTHWSDFAMRWKRSENEN